MSARESPDEVPRVRVLAVDDAPLFLELLDDLLGATPEFEVVGRASGGERAIELAHALRPDLILMDVRMPGLGGIDAARRIKEIRPSTVVVLISTTHPDELPREAHTDVADAIVWKSELSSKLVESIWKSTGPG
jgi:DNA-binding NarL/FixJ family response regulator